MNKRLPKILKINSVDEKNLMISVLFSTGEDRVLNFGRILTESWKVREEDVEYQLLDPSIFAKVEVVNHTLSWDSVELYMSGLDGEKKSVPYEVGADTLYSLSKEDRSLSFSIGTLLREARLAAKLSQEEVALLSGTSRTYITRLENDKQDIELMTLKKIVEAGLNKHLSISIE